MIKECKDKVRQRLIAEYSSLFSREIIDAEKLKVTILGMLEDLANREKTCLADPDKQKVIGELVDEFTGFGPIENLLKDQKVTEIMINGPHSVYVERGGRQELTGISFDDEKQLMHIIHKMLAPGRRRVDESYPYTEISLKDGSRVNIVIPPISLDGPTVTIRKFLKEIKTEQDLIALGTLDSRMSAFLAASIKAKANIIFSGATGAGKTTTLNVFSSHIPEQERIITIEDTSELHLIQKHVVRLEVRQPNIEGKGEISIRQLFKNSLRMRPDRIILGEIRGAEALDMLQAICSGHGGSLSVLHASSPQDAIYRIETMILTSGAPIGLEAIHRQIAASINLIVQQEQLADGSRKITYITQVHGLKDGQVVLEDLFLYDLEGVDVQGKIKGGWKATGISPSFYALFKKSGIDLPGEMFSEE